MVQESLHATQKGVVHDRTTVCETTIEASLLLGYCRDGRPIFVARDVNARVVKHSVVQMEGSLI